MRVLLIDVDPRASLTIYMKQAPFAPEERKQTLYQALNRDRPIGDILLDGNPELIPSSIILSEAEGALMADWGAVNTLQEKLSPLLSRFDYVLIDCPLTLTVLIANAIAAADQVLIPVKTDFLSMMGLRLMLSHRFDAFSVQRQQQPSRILSKRRVTVRMTKCPQQILNVLFKPLARRLAHHSSPKYP